jgi:hypothetical protein
MHFPAIMHFPACMIAAKCMIAGKCMISAKGGAKRGAGGRGAGRAVRVTAKRRFHREAPSVTSPKHAPVTPGNTSTEPCLVNGGPVDVAPGQTGRRPPADGGARPSASGPDSKGCE